MVEKVKAELRRVQKNWMVIKIIPEQTDCCDPMVTCREKKKLN